jgi:hypothetical protein
VNPQVIVEKFALTSPPDDGNDKIGCKIAN